MRVDLEGYKTTFLPLRRKAWQQMTEPDRGSIFFMALPCRESKLHASFKTRSREGPPCCMILQMSEQSVVTGLPSSPNISSQSLCSCLPSANREKASCMGLVLLAGVLLEESGSSRMCLGKELA